MNVVEVLSRVEYPMVGTHSESAVYHVLF